MKAINPNRRIFASKSIVFLVAGLRSAQSLAQQGDDSIEVVPLGRWAEYRQVQYQGAPILVHLRTGYERALVMPEPITLQNSIVNLPDCEVLLKEDNVVVFRPAMTFTRRSIKFVGQISGDIYDLRVRASDSGIRQPLQVNRI